MKNKYIKYFVFIVFLVILIYAFVSCKKTDDIELKTDNEISTEPEISETVEPEPEEDTEFDDDDWDDDDWDDEEDEEDDGVDTTTKEKATQDPNYNNPPQQTYYSYLTGIKCTRRKQRKRPVSIIINNYKPAMPMVGISHADIIYECMVEGGITRFMMVIADYEDVPVFGSVRSSREYFIDLSRTHDTIYVHAGGNPQDYDSLIYAR